VCVYVRVVTITPAVCGVRLLVCMVVNRYQHPLKCLTCDVCSSGNRHYT